MKSNDKKEIVEGRLDEVIAESRRKAVEQLRTMQGLELDDAKVMRRAWR